MAFLASCRRPGLLVQTSVGFSVWDSLQEGPVCQLMWMETVAMAATVPCPSAEVTYYQASNVGSCGEKAVFRPSPGT